MTDGHAWPGHFGLFYPSPIHSAVPDTAAALIPKKEHLLFIIYLRDNPYGKAKLLDRYFRNTATRLSPTHDGAIPSSNGD
jgi:hypothetical protein